MTTAQHLRRNSDDDTDLPPGASQGKKPNPAKRRPGTERYKIQIQLSEKARDRLFELVDRTEAESAAQVVRDALRVYDILLQEIDDNGNDLFLRSGASGEVVRLKLF